MKCETILMITSAVKGSSQIGDLNEEKKAGNLYKP